MFDKNHFSPFSKENLEKKIYFIGWSFCSNDWLLIILTKRTTAKTDNFFQSHIKDKYLSSFTILFLMVPIVFYFVLDQFCSEFDELWAWGLQRQGPCPIEDVGIRLPASKCVRKYFLHPFVLFSQRGIWDLSPVKEEDIT